MDDGQNQLAWEDADDGIVAGRAADGDTAAFGVLVRRYTPLMRAYTRRMLPGTADVDDVVQDTWITAWQQLPELDDPARARSWLLRIASRKAIDRIRATRVVLDITEIEAPAPAGQGPQRIAESHAGVAALGRALDELPAPQRDCWVLRELGGYSYEDIATELELSHATVRGLLARARKHIIVRMEEWR